MTLSFVSYEAATVNNDIKKYLYHYVKFILIFVDSLWMNPAGFHKNRESRFLSYLDGFSRLDTICCIQGSF
ncbi:MAG: Hypothetical protein BHV28_11330 [Candidatus Tokpelaia hoelldobleri]|uniref:Uncharacterized protein n=1 Tax=Candidatus Tokpelaia hoelldobleri TaxID=1902579 RepID=A0A1U9JVF1_9HYPH|nr:MAG: Hypothetical protein BHV28_11330 [Candidatus Tokpelaia hoelldoblerii]